MERSDARRAALLFLTIASTACGQLTGLTDDFDFGEAGADGSTTDAGDSGTTTIKDSGAETGPVTDSGPVCSAAQMSTASKDLNVSGSSNSFPTGCEACLVDKCCTSVIDCDENVKNADCKNEMACVVACVSKGGLPAAVKACLATCTNQGQVFFDAISACTKSLCVTDACKSLQP